MDKDTLVEVKQSVESGEYFREARKWYDHLYHAPISHRSILILITGLAVAIIFMSLMSLFIFLPVRENAPMVVRMSDSIQKMSRVEPLVQSYREDVDLAVMKWFIRDYISVYEGYDINRQQFFFRRVYALSAPEVYRAYVNFYKSAGSPTFKYERHTKRTTRVENIRFLSEDIIEDRSGNQGEIVEVKAKVTFVGVEEAQTEILEKAFEADVVFRYQKLFVDQQSGVITPMEFIVTDYKSKQLGL